MLDRLFPTQADNRFGGRRVALWLLGVYVAIKLVMSFNSIFFAARVAGGADGILLDSFGQAAVSEVLTMFSLTGLGQLTLALVALTVLLRYRALVPFMFLVLLGEAFARRLIVQSDAAARADAGATAFYINAALLALLAAGLVLSLLRTRIANASDSGNGRGNAAACGSQPPR